jgi:hypothetical protein
MQSEEYSSSFLQNVTCHARGSKVQHVNVVADAVNQTKCGLRLQIWGMGDQDGAPGNPDRVQGETMRLYREGLKRIRAIMPTLPSGVTRLD